MARQRGRRPRDGGRCAVTFSRDDRRLGHRVRRWSAEKPVGLVCFGLAKKSRKAISERRILPGDRDGIRAATVAHAFAMIQAQI
jgi:hypothetical protein